MLVLVTGANGQLGKSLNNLVLQRKLNHQFIFTTKEQLDLSNFNKVRSFIEKNKFDIIINCAAYTSVDEAETEIDYARLINHFAVKNIAEIAKDNSIKLIHISTDYVFNGLKQGLYDENDIPSPLNEYGKTKLEGENAILSVMQFDAIILRTSWVYSVYGNNFVKTMIRLFKKNHKLNIISDQIGSPTNANDLSDAILSILNSKKFCMTDQSSQIFHYSNDGKCSWYIFAKEIASILDTKCIVSPIDSADYPQDALRPKHVLMNKKKIVDYFDIKIVFWKDSLNSCLKNISLLSND